MTKTASEILNAELNGPRHSAVYDTAFDLYVGQTGLRLDQLSEAQLLAATKHAEEADRKAVFGFDYQTDRDGNPNEQGIGAKGRETLNHFNAMLANEKRGILAPGSYAAAIQEIWKRDPERARKIGLAPPPRAATSA